MAVTLIGPDDPLAARRGSSPIVIELIERWTDISLRKVA